MDNIGNYHKVLDLYWSMCGFQGMYIVDIYMYVVVDPGTGDIVDSDRLLSTLEDRVRDDYSNYVGG